jgi:hypothetical protein
MGQAAARSNATVYTVHIDTTPGVGAGLAESARQLRTGARSRVTGELAQRLLSVGRWTADLRPRRHRKLRLRRILRETSAYYLLGVEPAAEDRDGRPRKLGVKVRRGGSASAAVSGW